MNPTHVQPPAPLTTVEIEVICRRVFGEMKSAIETQQALLVQELKVVNATLIRIEQSQDHNFIRKETFDGWTDRIARVEKFVYGAIGLGMTALGSAVFSLVFKK